ncbi:MAG: hypothetical protein OJF62_000331 [Pseudolabrys sp.]|nr:hypothetical protein [Pseudolabrys sp.]
MSNRTVKYTAGDIGRVRVIDDFLPPPDTLVPRKLNPPHPEEGAKRPSRRMGRRPHGSRRAAARRSSP